MPFKITALPALRDNYIWMIIHEDTRCAVVIDPGDASVVIHALQEQALTLSAILITHHHWDHTDGVKTLKQQYGIPVYGPNRDTVPEIDHLLSDSETLYLENLELEFNILGIPGHTLDHIAYYGHNALFCGDTLFSAGCGRLFEGTAEQLYHSLSKLKQLPDTTDIYCAHEYTLNNLAFALTVEPHNSDCLAYRKKMEEKRTHQQPTLPSSLTTERLINPFLRCDQPSVQAAVRSHANIVSNEPVAIFTALRKWKDKF